MRNIWDIVTGRRAPEPLKQISSPITMLDALAGRGAEINKLVRESAGTHGEVAVRHLNKRVKGLPLVVDPDDMTAISNAMR